MPAVKKEQEMEKLLALDDKTFPVIGAPKEKVPFNETIGQRIPGKLSRKRSSNSLDRKKSVNGTAADKEIEEKTEPMEEETVESVNTMTKSKKKREAKKRKLMALKLVDVKDKTLSQEGQHFQTFCRKQFSVIIGRMGKSSLYLLVLSIFTFYSEKLYNREAEHYQEYL